MKIAISGSNDELRYNLIKSFISQWPMYATPADTIFNSMAKEEEIPEDLKESFSKMNDLEKELFKKLILFENQLGRFVDKGHIIFDGSSIDILINTLILCEQCKVSEEFTEKVIYHNKKILRLLDVIYFIPDNSITENSEEYEKIIESVYWNFYDNYQTDFANSPFFDQKNCPSILLLDSSSPINEIKLLLDKNGNLDSTSQCGVENDLIDNSVLKRALRQNPKLLEAALESLKNSKRN